MTWWGECNYSTLKRLGSYQIRSKDSCFQPEDNKECQINSHVLCLCPWADNGRGGSLNISAGRSVHTNKWNHGDTEDAHHITLNSGREKECVYWNEWHWYIIEKYATCCMLSHSWRLRFLWELLGEAPPWNQGGFLLDECASDWIMGHQVCVCPVIRWKIPSLLPKYPCWTHTLMWWGGLFVSAKLRDH